LHILHQNPNLTLPGSYHQSLINPILKDEVGKKKVNEKSVELRKNIFDCYFSTKVRAEEALIYIAYTETN
jgi:hypothetical protein